MRIIIDYNRNPEFDNGWQIVRDEDTGEELRLEEINQRVVVEVYTNRYGQAVMILSDHLFEDKG